MTTSAVKYPAKITTALSEVMAKVGYVQKTGKNAFHNYKYAGEADLLEALRPAMVEAGLLLIPSVHNVTNIDDHGNVFVTMAYTLAHKDGDVWPDKVFAVGCGNDLAKSGKVGDKGAYKAITGANKYLLFKLFQIETGDDPEKTETAVHDAPAEPEKLPAKDSEVATLNICQAIITTKTLPQLEALKKGEWFKLSYKRLIETDQQAVQTCYGDRKAELEGA
jgi:hypothetical protein